MPSLFGEMLAELVGTIPGAVGAVFVDWEGEAVDQFSHIPPFDIQLLGAHWGIVLRLIQETLTRHEAGAVRRVLVNGQDHDIVIQSVTEEYCVVLALHAGTHLATALDCLDRVSESIRQEM